MSDHVHHFSFWGDDPYLICECGQVLDALTGRLVRPAAPSSSEEKP